MSGERRGEHRCGGTPRVGRGVVIARRLTLSGVALVVPVLVASSPALAGPSAYVSN